MPEIRRSLVRFTECLEKNIPIVCEKGGVWRRESGISSAIRYLSGGESKRLSTICQAFGEALNRLEKTPIVFSQDADVCGAQRLIFGDFLKAADALQKKLKTSNSPQAKEHLTQIAQRIIALKYRLEKTNGGFDSTETNPEQYAKLLQFAEEWKNKNPYYVDKTITKQNLAKLSETSTYPEFVNLLLSDKSLRSTYFSWIMRENCGAEQFIEFPAACARIKAAHLSSRIGRFAGNMFPIMKTPREDINQDAVEKVVCLPFHTNHQVKKYISILDETKEVTLRGDWRWTIADILKSFDDKSSRVGDLEFFSSLGISNWNIKEVGWWNPKTQSYVQTDLDKPEWWWQLPVFDEMTKAEVESYYRRSVKEGEWVVCAISTRQTLDVDFVDCHAYLEAAIPLGNGKYRIFPLGKFPLDFPSEMLETLLFITGTVTSKMEFPDENAYYAHRQHAHYPETYTAVEGRELMALIRQELISSREGNAIFQFEGEGCGSSTQRIMELTKKEGIPNLFKSALLESEPNNPLLKAIFTFLRTVPAKWQNQATSFFDYSLGAWRGKTVIEDGKEIFKSVADHPDRKVHMIYQPAMLHQRIEKGLIKGYITYGM